MLWHHACLKSWKRVGARCELCGWRLVIFRWIWCSVALESYLLMQRGIKGVCKHIYARECLLNMIYRHQFKNQRSESARRWCVLYAYNCKEESSAVVLLTSGCSLMELVSSLLCPMSIIILCNLSLKLSTYTYISRSFLFLCSTLLSKFVIEIKNKNADLLIQLIVESLKCILKRPIDLPTLLTFTISDFDQNFEINF